MERATTQTPDVSTLGASVEPGADRCRPPLDFPGDLSMRISHEAIYQALYADDSNPARSGLERQLRATLQPDASRPLCPEVFPPEAP